MSSSQLCAETWSRYVLDISPCAVMAHKKRPKGKSRAELEKLLAPSDLAHDKERANIGEAAAYGIYFDDTQYDYMQHLKPVGMHEDGVDSIWLEAPSAKSKGKGRAKDPIELLDLPEGTLPSKSELPRNYEAQQDIPSSIAGFQPDMDPHLRQVLEALEDDAFVDEGLEDDFFGELVAHGERAPDEDYGFEFREQGVPDGGDAAVEGEVTPGEDEDESWEARFARFKREQKSAPQDEDTSDLDAYSEGGDTIGTLPQLSVIGGKKRRRKGASDASGYSMSSSSMWRNENLTILDERFDQVCPRGVSSASRAPADPADRSNTSTTLLTRKTRRLPLTIWTRLLTSSRPAPTSRT